MVRRFSAVRRGLTLIELVVVVAILGVLAAMLLPKFEGLQSSANHAAAASSAADAARVIGTYKSSKMVYPDGWDSLMSGTALWTPGNVGQQTKGLHLQLSDPTTGKLTNLSTALTSTQVTALASAGITKVYNLTTTLTSSRPGDMFTTPETISTTTKLAIVNPGTSGGKKIIDHIYRQNLQPGMTSGTINPDTSGVGDGVSQLIVFGIGPQSALVPNSMLEAPTYGNVNAQFIYNRLLAVFELTASKVTFKGVLGCDGDLLDDMSVHMNNAAL